MFAAAGLLVLQLLQLLQLLLFSATPALAGAFTFGIAGRTTPTPQPIDDCPGYTAKNVAHSDHGLTADLALAGQACNTYGTDLDNLKLVVEYQSGKSLLLDIDCIHKATKPMINEIP
jgi:alpha-glucosidase